MKKLIYLLPLLIFFAGCMKTNTREYEPLVPFGTFTGKFTRTHTNPTTLAKDITTANIELVMTTSGFTVTSDAGAVHANGSGEFLGNEISIDFNDPNYPATGPVPNAYLYGTYTYTFNGSDFKLTRAAADDLLEYVLVKKF
jgi:hypothetical protein